MTVEELIEELRGVPQTARVEIQVRANLSYDGQLEQLYEFRNVDPVTVVYDLGIVQIQLDE